MGARTVVAVTAAVGAMVSITGATSAATDRGVGFRLAAVNAAAGLPAGAIAQGPVGASSTVSGVVALRLRDPAGASAFVARVSDPRSALYHHYLAPGEFARMFGPLPATVEAVRRQLAADGLRVAAVSANGLLISFSGSASTAERAFGTGLQQVRLANGAMGRRTTSAVRLPATIAGDVQAVVGLNELVHLRTGLIRARHLRHHVVPSAPPAPAGSGGPVACAAASQQEALGALTDEQVATAYGVGGLYRAGDLAAGQTVDIYELEPFQISDVQAFDQCYFGADHTGNIAVSTVDGGPGVGPGGGEAALDVEDVSGLAPSAHIHVFSGPNMNDSFGPLDTWNAIAIADDARQVSSSWGLCETALQVGAPGVQQVENEIFQQMAAQGQSVFVAAGDDGSDDCAGHASVPAATNLSLDDPASQPYAVSVGGTTILAATDPPSETVWNNGNDGGAGGGGISETWAMPAWQTGVAVPENGANEACSNDPGGTADDFHLAGDPTNLPAGTLCRQTPDVSALADPQSGITIFYAGTWFPIGGTSSSAPLWAAMLAEVNGYSSCAGAPLGVGFVNPLLYQVAESSKTNYANAFNDITIGNNDNLGVGSGTDYPAAPGYDLATGLGTPRITSAQGPGLAAQLCNAVTRSAGTAPTLTALTPSAGPATPPAGTIVTITGSRFGTARGSVFFGDVSATVTRWSSTTITVDLPAYHAPPGTGGSPAGSAIVTVVTAGTPARSTAPGPNSVFHYAGGPAGNTPVVDYVSSPAGPAAGGNSVTLVGAGFTGVTSVTFGGVAASTVHVLGASRLSVTVPPQGSAICANATPGICQVPVVVTTANGSSSGPPILPAYTGPIAFQPSGALVPPPGCGCEVSQAPEEYDYAPAPVITGAQPSFASEAGGTVVAITGTGFNLLELYWYNVGPAGQNFSEQFFVVGVTPTELDVVIPPTAPTTEPFSVPLSVQTAGGLSNVVPVDYAGIPAVSGLSVNAVAVQSPGTLTITGQGLSDATSVEFVGQGSLNFISSTSNRFVGTPTDTSLTVQVPQFFAIPTDVLVCSVTACSAPNPAVDTLVFAYAGRPTVTSSSPTSGPAAGGTEVTINGTLDSELTRVSFGKAAATIVSEPFASPSGQIVVDAPPGTAGQKVFITISTVGGTLTSPPQPTSAKTNDATFTYK